ncbi:gephyrin-like molybdotransferase Glp [Hyphomicrobium sp. CS1GBMeth3]|uniref:molybdopterin molybdotransferase MoeA n=1 Tax=Hyphomicrobium sp. CS1GBMeth3 TaxID=1892845 RepID=UPI00092FF2B6|nr:gephyrin-like molybdotransferase Glp [Hyphomicrobium sp. CS1GBMeth3]
MALLPVATALTEVLDGIGPPIAETVSLGEADGRVLADDIAARLTQPPFNASAMDGYAVFGDGPAAVGDRWTVVGESAAGHAFTGTVERGQAVRIFTGAPVPAGCGTVVIQENVSRTGDLVTAIDATRGGANIRLTGCDFADGDVLLARGRRLDAHTLTLAAAMGHADLPVARRPVVAILATGDELVAPGTLPGPDQIISSNPVGIGALVRRAGGVPRELGIAPDRMEDLAACIAEAKDADVLVTIGGASVGDHDLVAEVLKREGLNLAFWKIALRPGKPLMFGRLGTTRVLGLPGNPVSALITARVFLVPLIHALLGEKRQGPATETARLTAPLEANGPRLHLMRGTLGRRTDGALTVTPLPSQDSSLLSALAAADCLIWRAPGAAAAAAGEPVLVERLELSW